jgi:SseB protein N-terminal domain
VPRATTSSAAGDSAGQPWTGRTLPAGGFSGDDGRADAGVHQALQRVELGVGGAADVVAALAVARVMVAVVAVLGEGEDHTAAAGDKQADMALMTVTGPDGRRALPVFTSPVTLATWDGGARPVPVSARRAAHAALAEGCERLVLDVAGPMTFLVSRSALVALAQGRAWRPAHEDPVVAERLAALVAEEADVLGVGRRPGTTAELRVELGVRPGLSRDELTRLADRVRGQLTADEVLRERVDGLELAVVRG